MRVEFIVPFVASLAIGQATPATLPLAEPKSLSQPPVIGQITPATSGGITVIGRSMRTVKADTVVFTASVQPGPNGDPIVSGDEIVASLKKDGIADAAWTVQSLSPRYSSISITGSGPLQTADALKKIFLDAATAAGSAVSQNIQLNLQLRNCTTALDALRKSSLDDARQQAEKIAADLGLKLGPPISANAALYNTGDRCPGETMINLGNQGGLGSGPWNPDGLVTLSSTITVTFAIAK
jgi:uncharacterized protein YggE